VNLQPALFCRTLGILLNGFLLVVVPTHAGAGGRPPCWPEPTQGLAAQFSVESSLCDSLVSLDAASENEAIMVVTLPYFDLRALAFHARSASGRWRLGSLQVRPLDGARTAPQTAASQPDRVEATLRWIRVREPIGEDRPSSGAGAAGRRP
jgi:hypothetical protein